VAATDVSIDEQAVLSEAIVAQGCGSAVCAGFQCSTWDDSIDMVSVMAEAEGRPRPSVVDHVMTSWHEDEPIEDVADFFFRHTRIDGIAPDHFAAVIVGGSAQEVETVTRAVVSRSME
jgi:hypothetical protein